MAIKEEQILQKYTKGCWARPAFQQELVVDRCTHLSIMKWKCLLCDQQYKVNKRTTGNIREHLRCHHGDFARKLITKSSSSIDNPKSSNQLIQTHIDKKAKVVQFSDQGMVKWLVKYSIITDQSFLHAEHPIFVGMLNYLHPGIDLPSRKTLKKKLQRLSKLRNQTSKQCLCKF